MAISTVRAKFNGSWVNLAYNSATGKYEGTITPGSASTYYIDLEASNSTGKTVSVSGTALPALKLVVVDTTPPALTVNAPSDGSVTSADSVTVTGTATDNSGSVNVTVNGTAVTVAANGTFSRSVALSAGSNTITVIATDPSGNKTTVTRTVARATSGPVLTITAPAANAVLRTASVTVTGTVSDSVSPVSSVTVNGVAAAVSGGMYTATVPLAEGDNTITVVGANQVGLTTTTTVSVTRDSIAPSIALTAPTAGQVTSSAEFTVTGTVGDDGSGLTGVTVNGSAAVVSGGTFSRTIALTEGVNPVVAVAEDRAGNTATVTGSVLLDTIPPALSVTYPAAALITNQAQITVTGIASDSGSGLGSVSVDGQQVPVRDGAFSAVITLLEGENTVTVTATDRAGHTATVTRSVLLDTVKPTITLVSPPEGWLTTTRPTVEFSASDEPDGSGVDMESAQVTVDGQPAAAAVDGDTITVQFELADGPHVVTATVRDMAGNVQSLSVVYRVDTMPPELYLHMPDSHRVVDSEAVVISGTATDAGSPPCRVRVSVNGTDLGETETVDVFSLTVPLTVGANIILVTVQDRAGLATAREIGMIRLITDRTQEDVDVLTALLMLPLEQWTSEELEWFNGGVVRGAYNADDLNRVCLAADWLADWLTRYGYSVDVAGKRGWVLADIPTQGQMNRYLDGVRSIRDALPVRAQLPESMEMLDLYAANEIEAALVQADALRPLMDLSPVYSGEAFAGEF